MLKHVSECDIGRFISRLMRMCVHCGNLKTMMKHIVLSILTILLAFGCSEEEPLQNILVTTSSGDRLSMDGEWAASCVSAGSNFISEVFQFKENKITLSIDTYTTPDCGAPPDANEVIEMSFEVGGVYSVSLDGKEVMANKIQGVSKSNKSSESEPFKQAFYIDDTASQPALYHGVFGDDGGKLSSDGYPLELHPIAIIKEKG